MRKFSSLLYALFLSWTPKTGTYLKFTWAIKDWLCYLLADKHFLLISAWNRLKNEEKKHIFISMFSPYFNCYCLHPVLIYSSVFKV